MLHHYPNSTWDMVKKTYTKNIISATYYLGYDITCFHVVDVAVDFAPASAILQNVSSKTLSLSPWIIIEIYSMSVMLGNTKKNQVLVCVNSTYTANNVNNERNSNDKEQK